MKANKRFNGKPGEEYDLSAIAFPYRNHQHALITKIIKNEFSKESIKTINALEIGFGTGFTTEAILRSDKRIKVTSIDNEPKMLKQAKMYLSKNFYNKRYRLILSDALTFLEKQRPNQFNVFVSALTIHNFEKDYRKKVIKDIYTILRSGGIFINVDKYALDSKSKHKKSLEWQLISFKEKYSKINRQDLVEEWTRHYIYDDKPDIIMKESDSIRLMKRTGFRKIRIFYRKQMEAILVARK
jgi:tRNA (cmo5U34)-methyltransferase